MIKSQSGWSNYVLKCLRPKCHYVRYCNFCKVRTAIDVLNQNKQSLTAKQATRVKSQCVGEAVSWQKKMKPFHHINYEYIHSLQFWPKSLRYHAPELSQLAQMITANTALSSGQDFQDYPLPKIINICLKKLEREAIDYKFREQETGRDTNQQEVNEGNHKQWSQLSIRVHELCRNISLMDNIQLIHIAFSKKEYFNLKFRHHLIDLLAEELNHLTQLEKQQSFFVLCQINATQAIANTRGNQEFTAIHRLQFKQQSDEQLLQDKLTTKIKRIQHDIIQSTINVNLPVYLVVSWIVIHSVCSLSAMELIAHFIRKLQTLNRKKKVDIGAIETVLDCLHQREKLLPDRQKQPYRQLTVRTLQLQQLLIENLTKKTFIFNQEALHRMFDLKAEDSQMRLKFLLSSQQIQNKYLQLSNEQLGQAHQLSVSDRIHYLYLSWRDDLLQLYEIQSIYLSLDLQAHLCDLRGKGFAGIDIVYYSCVLELALSKKINKEVIISWIEDIEYLPRGLDWPIWNYLQQVIAEDRLNQQLVLRVQQAITQIRKSQSQRQMSSVLRAEASRMEKNKRFQDINKFFNSVRLWQLEKLVPIGPGGYISHFCHPRLRILLHCLSESDFTQSGDQLNNQYLLDEKMLKENYGFETIRVDVNKLMQMNYSDRVRWLQSQFQTLKSGNMKSLQPAQLIE